MEGMAKKLSTLDENTNSAESKKINAEFFKLYQERNTFIKEDSTGFVWLYLQK